MRGKEKTDSVIDLPHHHVLKGQLADTSGVHDEEVHEVQEDLCEEGGQTMLEEPEREDGDGEREGKVERWEEGEDRFVLAV